LESVFCPSFRAGFPELKDFDPIIQIILLFLGDISLIGIMSIVAGGFQPSADSSHRK
jgi:hypothetical protein